MDRHGRRFDLVAWCRFGLDASSGLCQWLCMRGEATKAVRLTNNDLAIVDAVREKLGCRTVSEVLRMGLRSLAREQQLVVKEVREAETTVEYR